MTVRPTHIAACIAALAMPLLVSLPAGAHELARVGAQRDLGQRALVQRDLDAHEVLSAEEMLRESVVQSAREASRLRHSPDYQPQNIYGARPQLPAMDAGMSQVVADGALAVTARLQSPALTWQGSDGVRGLDSEVEAQSQDRFRVASNTKMMIATLVMQEVQAGTWTLDTLVEDVLPGTFPDHPDVTLRHLLSHTSGAPTGSDIILLLRMTDPTDIDEMFALLGEHFTEQEHVFAANLLPWQHGPGEGFTYSNAGYVVLGMMLEEVTGQSVADLLQARIFDPARMSASGYPLSPGVPEPFMDEAAYLGETNEPWRDLSHFDPTIFYASGAAVSTTGDLTRFTSALFGGELVSPELVEVMSDPVDEQMGYGLGIYRIPDPCYDPALGRFLIGHDGATYGTLSVAFASPDGQRNLAMGITGRNISADPEALYDLNEVLVPLLIASCTGVDQVGVGGSARTVS